MDEFELREKDSETVLRPPAEAFTPAGRTKTIDLPLRTGCTYQIVPRSVDPLSI